MLDHDLVFAGSQLMRTMSSLGNDSSKYVNRTSHTTGAWHVVSAGDWTSGFLGGAMWQLFKATGNSFWSTQAKAWTLGLASQSSQEGDLAFRLLTTFKPLYDLTKNAAYKQVLLDAAAFTRDFEKALHVIMGLYRSMQPA